MSGTPDPQQPRPRRILAVCEGDSYVKWAAFLLDTLPAHWTTELVVLRTLREPSPRQVASALARTSREGREVPHVAAPQLSEFIAGFDPDAVVIAAIGPLIEVLTHEVLRWRGARPVLMSGIPGIAVPAGLNVWSYRARTDLIVVHSPREVRDFDSIARAFGVPGKAAVATLPFLRAAAEAQDAAPPVGRKPRVVFAAQALVPGRAADRRRILEAMAQLATDRPDLDVVVKLRGYSDEAQTHREDHNFHDLWAGICAEQGYARELLVFDTDSMAQALQGAVGFVTVSSTAVLEAIAAGVPILLLADFGISAKLINVVFTESGCMGTLDDLAAGRFHMPDQHWLQDNYFHALPEERTWVATLEDLVARRDRGELAELPSITETKFERRKRRAEFMMMTMPLPVAKAVTDARRGTREVKRQVRKAAKPLHPRRLKRRIVKQLRGGSRQAELQGPGEATSGN